MRQVDCVTVKGSSRPVGLFTYDVDLSGLDSLRCLSMQKTVGGAGSWCPEGVRAWMGGTATPPVSAWGRCQGGGRGAAVGFSCRRESAVLVPC